MSIIIDGIIFLIMGFFLAGIVALGEYPVAGVLLMLPLALMFTGAVGVDHHFKTRYHGEKDYFTCRYGVHPWQVYKRNPEFPEGWLPGAPALIEKYEEKLYGGQTLRVCRSCDRVERLTYDARGCVSITDSPSPVWVKVDLARE